MLNWSKCWPWPWNTEVRQVTQGKGIILWIYISIILCSRVLVVFWTKFPYKQEPIFRQN